MLPPQIFPQIPLVKTVNPQSTLPLSLHLCKILLLKYVLTVLTFSQTIGQMVRAYYNEIEPYVAEWLRNLIKAGEIAPGDVDERDIRDVTPALNPLVGNSSGQGAHGMLDREPKLFQAMSSSLLTATHRYADALVYGLNPEPFFHRKIRKPLEHRGWFSGNGPDWNPATASFLSGHGKSLPLWGDVHESFSPTVYCWPGGTHQSKATYSPGRVQGRLTCHISGMDALEQETPQDASFYTEPYISRNNISYEGGSRGVSRHILCTSVHVPCKNGITSYWICQ